MAEKVPIYHNPACGTSRNTLIAIPRADDCSPLQLPWRRDDAVADAGGDRLEDFGVVEEAGEPAAEFVHDAWLWRGSKPGYTRRRVGAGRT